MKSFFTCLAAVAWIGLVIYTMDYANVWGD